MRQKSEKLLSWFSNCIQCASVDVNIIVHRQIFQLLNLLTHQNKNRKYDVSLCTDSTKDLQLKQNQRDVSVVQLKCFEWLFCLTVKHEHVQIWQDCNVLWLKNLLVDFVVAFTLIILFKKRRQDSQQEAFFYIENTIKLDCDVLSDVEFHLHTYTHVRWSSDSLNCHNHLSRILVLYLVKCWLLIQWQH